MSARGIWIVVAVLLASCQSVYKNPYPSVPPQKPMPSQEEIAARVGDILTRAKAVQRVADEVVKLDGSENTSRVFTEVRACRLGRAGCTDFEAQAERGSKVGAQAGFACWLVDGFAGWTQDVARARMFGELFMGGTSVVRGDGVVVGSRPPEIEPALVQAEALVKEATAAAQPLADARAARKAEREASAAAAKDCDAQGRTYCNAKCDAGDAVYCEMVALQEWKWDPPNFEAAKMLLARACDGGVKRACEELPQVDADMTRVPEAAWAAVQAVGDRIAANRFTLATVLKVRPTAANVRDVATARALEPKTISDEYCPARAAFVRLQGAEAFRRRAATHCKDTPPTAQGITGAQVPLPEQCTAVYAISCPATPTPAPRPLPHVATPTCVACPAGTHGEGKMNSPACWCTTGDASKDAHMSTLNVQPPSPSCRPAGACATGCAFSCP